MLLIISEDPVLVFNFYYNKLKKKPLVAYSNNFVKNQLSTFV